VELDTAGSEDDTPIQESPRRLVVLSSSGGRHVNAQARVVVSRGAIETVLDSASLELRSEGRLPSFLRDDIFDTFHAARSRSISEIPDDLLSDLAVEFAGVE
jgi:hypothetical protein